MRRRVDAFQSSGLHLLDTAIYPTGRMTSKSCGVNGMRISSAVSTPIPSYLCRRLRGRQYIALPSSGIPPGAARSREQRCQATLPALYPCVAARPGLGLRMRWSKRLRPHAPSAETSPTRAGGSSTACARNRLEPPMRPFGLDKALAVQFTEVAATQQAVSNRPSARPAAEPGSSAVSLARPAPPLLCGPSSPAPPAAGAA
jgi:hypothetical protein